MNRHMQSRPWQRAHLWALRLHILSESAVKSDPWGPGMPLRRAACLVPAHVALAVRRSSVGEAAHFWAAAVDAHAEAEELLVLGRDLGLYSAEDAEPLLLESTEVAVALTRGWRRVFARAARAGQSSRVSPRLTAPRAQAAHVARVRR